MLNADDGRRYGSYPSSAIRSASARASSKSKNPLYGTVPTMGNHQVTRSSLSRRAPLSTRTSVSRSSWLNVVKLSPASRPNSSSAKVRAASTSSSFPRASGVTTESATTSGMGRRPCRIRISSQVARAT